MKDLTTSTDRVLAVVPTYRDWDAGLGRDGVHDRMKDLLNDGGNHRKFRLDQALTGESKALASATRLLSSTIWQ